MKIGDKVKMVNCLEADKHPGKVWAVRSNPWDLCGSQVVLLEGLSGGFAVDCLEPTEDSK